jgi:hypothetical protein
MNCSYGLRCDGALLAEMLILGMDVAKSDAGGIMVLRSGKLMVLSQKSDLGGNQHTCGKLRASSTRLVWGGLRVPS